MKPELEIELKAVRLIQRRGLPVIPATIHIPEAQPGSFRPMTLEETRQAGADAARHLRRALLGKHPVICLLFVLFASFCSLRAATVTGLVQQITLNWSTNTTIIFSNISTPSITGGGALVTSQPKPSYTTTAGWFSNYLTFGTYKVFVGPSPRDIVTVQIPDDTGTYDLWSLRTNSLSTSSNAPTIVRGVAQGTNGILTVTNSGVVTVHFTGSTGGGSTDLTDLNAATNALNSRAASLEGQTNALGARVTSVESQTNSLGTRVTALEAGSGGVTTSVATNIAQYFATNATAAASNSLWLAPYALSFPTGLVVYTHPRSGFFTDSSGTAAATNQALIARWNDVSGWGNHLTSTNTTARTRLIYEAGNPIAFFANGESQQASNVLEFPPALMINSRAFSVFFVLQPMATLTNLGILQASNNNPGIIIEANGTERGVVSLYGSSLVQSHIQTRASWSVLGVVGDTNNARIYHHGESTNLAAYASATASGGIIGRWVNQRPFYGKIASVLLFDRALPAQEAESVVAKLEESFKLSTPNRNRLIIIGDSIVRGDTTSNGLSYAQQVSKRLGPEWETINLGLGGQYLSTIKNYATNTIVPLLAPGRRNVVLIEAGSNDIKLGGASGEDTFTNLVTLAGTITRAGGQVVAADILPRQADATFNTKRLTFNSLVSSTWTTWASGYAPFASDGTIGDSGDEANATYYSVTIHPTEQGAGIMANWTAPVILSLPLSYQPASAALTNLAGNPNVATNILGAGTVTVSSNNAGGWTITGSGSSADTSGLPSITRLDFQRRDPSNGITALTDESGLAYRLIGNTDQAQITNGAFKLNFKAIPTNGAAAVYIVGTNQQRLTALGMKYAVTNDTGSATTPFTVLIVQSNSLESAGTMQLGAGFHIPISNAGVDVQLYTNGVGSAISLGTIPFRNYFTDGYLRSLAVVFNGDNTITVQGDGIYGTVTNARVEAVRGAEGNTGHFTFEQYAVGTNITYQPLWASLWTANAAAWNQLKAAQDQSVNLDGQMFTRVSSNAFAHIGDQSVPVSAYQWWVSNTSKAMLLDSNGYLAIARSAKPDSAIRAPLSIYSPPGSSGGQVDLSSTADSQNVGLRFTRDQANKFFVGLLGNTSDLSIYSDNGGGLLSRWYDASGALYNVGTLTNGGGVYAQTGVAIGTNNLGPSALDVHGGIRLHRPPASSLLMLNGSQDLTNVTIGTGLQLIGNDLSTTGGGGGGEANFNGEASLTNATRIGLVAGKTGVTNLLRSIEPGFGLSITNQGTNVVPAVDSSVIASVAWANSISNLAASKQSGSFLLSNLLAMGISNIVAGTNMHIQTNSGTLVLNSTASGGGGGVSPGGEMEALMTLNGSTEWVDLGTGMYIDDSLQFVQSIFGGRDFGTGAGNRSFGQTYNPSGLYGSFNWFTCLTSNNQYAALRYGATSSTIGSAAASTWSNRFNASANVIVQGGGNTSTNIWIMFGATSERFDQGLTTDGVKWEAKPAGNAAATWYAGCGIGSTWTYVTSTIPVTNYLVKLSMRGDYQGVAFFTNGVWFAGISNNLPTNRIYSFGVRQIGVGSPATPATNQVLSFWRNIKAIIQ